MSFDVKQSAGRYTVRCAKSHVINRRKRLSTREQKTAPVARGHCRHRRCRVSAQVSDKQEEGRDSGSKERRQQQEEKRRQEIEKDFNPEDFSLPTAIALGCCSFEAYNAPYKSYGLKEVSPCGTEAIFMDREFLSGLISGILEVHLRRAVDLPEVQFEEGKKELPNARCRAMVFPSSGFSDVYEGTVDPSWRQTFFLYVRDPDQQSLELHVEHVGKNREEGNPVLGSATFSDLKGICDGKIHDLSLDLEGKAGACGKVELSVRYQEHSEENDLLGTIKQQAIGQMLTDDWVPGANDEWDPFAADSDWRFTGLPPTHDTPAVVDDSNPIDIEGGELVEGQPLDRPPWKAWSELREAVVGRQLFTSLDPLLFLVNKLTDTEVWMYRSTEKKQIVISFRGTSSPKDMLTDMSLDMAAFDPAGKRNSRAPEEVAEELSDEELENGPLGGFYKSMKVLEKLPGVHLVNEVIKKKAKKDGGRSAPQGLSGWAKAQMMMIYAVEHDEIWVHKGFLQAYLSVRDDIHRAVDRVFEADAGSPADERRGGEPSVVAELPSAVAELQQKTRELVGGLPEGERWHIYTTGHSMGGALATLSAHELAIRDYGLFGTNPQVTMYSFGQPRVGNGPFAKDYDEAVPDSWRVKNADDIVTRVPSLLGYQHVGCEVNLYPHGKVAISGVSTDDVREGAVLTDLLPKIKGGLTGEDEELKKEFQQLVKGEIEIFKAIVQGQGIGQHMEDMYHQYLDCCSGKGPEFCQPVISAVEDAKREAEEHLQEQKRNKKEKK